MKLRLTTGNLQYWCKDAIENEETKVCSIIESKIRIFFEAEFRIQDVLAALYDSEERLCWDTTALRKLEEKDLSSGATIQYSHYRSKLQFNVKDFVDKRVIFADDQDCVYCFSSQSSEHE